MGEPDDEADPASRHKWRMGVLAAVGLGLVIVPIWVLADHKGATTESWTALWTYELFIGAIVAATFAGLAWRGQGEDLRLQREAIADQQRQVTIGHRLNLVRFIGEVINRHGPQEQLGLVMKVAGAPWVMDPYFVPGDAKLRVAQAKQDLAALPDGVLPLHAKMFAGEELTFASREAIVEELQKELRDASRRLIEGQDL